MQLVADSEDYGTATPLTGSLNGCLNSGPSSSEIPISTTLIRPPQSLELDTHQLCIWLLCDELEALAITDGRALDTSSSSASSPSSPSPKQRSLSLSSEASTLDGQLVVSFEGVDLNRPPSSLSLDSLSTLGSSEEHGLPSPPPSPTIFNSTTTTSQSQPPLAHLSSTPTNLPRSKKRALATLLIDTFPELSTKEARHLVRTFLNNPLKHATEISWTPSYTLLSHPSLVPTTSGYLVDLSFGLLPSCSWGLIPCFEEGEGEGEGRAGKVDRWACRCWGWRWLREQVRR